MEEVQIKPNWLIIVNPNAGNKKCGNDWPQIRTIIESNLPDPEFLLTTRRLEAIGFAENAVKQGFRKIAVAGGDGTLNEVVNGIMNCNEISDGEVMVGMIPVGTGNDWCRMYDIPFDYSEAIEIIKREKTALQDIGSVSFSDSGVSLNRWFINVTGLGYDAVVAMKTNKDKERGKGTSLAYKMNMFSCLLSYKTLKSKITIDGNSIDRAVFSMNVGVCKYNGGGMIQVPEAIPDDGILDLTIINKIARWKVVANTKKLYNGTIKSLPFVEIYKAKDIKIEAGGRMYIEVDGESLGTDPFHFTIVPSAIRVVSGKE
ncbi:MAG: diacylglycerol kinase family lipid kinase [Bacteroidetes bacterium]|nr:diacylglycerol kinase family lipid kinase [Bacteroidota bacterium]MBU1717538.1 diacylglycerol kinase family lipid kinase [Bacteroidota bacterium]